MTVAAPERPAFRDPVLHVAAVAAAALVQAVLFDSSPFARACAAAFVAAVPLLIAMRRRPTPLVLATGLLLIASAADRVFIPFASSSGTLMETVGAVPIWALAVQCIFFGRLLDPREGDAAAAPTVFFASCVFYGMGGVLLLEAMLAAGAAGHVGAGSVVLHAFAAETGVHVVILVLWAGLSVRAAGLYARLSRPGASRSASSTVERDLIEALSRLLPMLGFLGTVIGLAGAVAAMGAGLETGGFGRSSLDGLFRSLAVKFETSLLGIAAAVVMGWATALIDARASHGRDDPAGPR